MASKPVEVVDLTGDDPETPVVLVDLTGDNDSTCTSPARAAPGTSPARAAPGTSPARAAPASAVPKSKPKSQWIDRHKRSGELDAKTDPEAGTPAAESVEAGRHELR